MFFESLKSSPHEFRASYELTSTSFHAASPSPPTLPPPLLSLPNPQPQTFRTAGWSTRRDSSLLDSVFRAVQQESVPRPVLFDSLTTKPLSKNCTGLLGPLSVLVFLRRGGSRDRTPKPGDAVNRFHLILERSDNEFDHLLSCWRPFSTAVGGGVFRYNHLVTLSSPFSFPFSRLKL